MFDSDIFDITYDINIDQFLNHILDFSQWSIDSNFVYLYDFWTTGYIEQNYWILFDLDANLIFFYPSQFMLLSTICQILSSEYIYGQIMTWEVLVYEPYFLFSQYFLIYFESFFGLFPEFHQNRTKISLLVDHRFELWIDEYGDEDWFEVKTIQINKFFTIAHNIMPFLFHETLDYAANAQVQYFEHYDLWVLHGLKYLFSINLHEYPYPSSNLWRLYETAQAFNVTLAEEYIWRWKRLWKYQYKRIGYRAWLRRRVWTNWWREVRREEDFEVPFFYELTNWLEPYHTNIGVSDVFILVILKWFEQKMHYLFPFIDIYEIL